MSSLNRNLLWLLGIGLLALVGWYFSDIITYIILAWVLSMLGKPLMVFFMKKVRVGKFSVGRGGAAMLTILTFYTVLAGLVLIFVPTIVQQARNLAGVDYQALGEKLRVPFQNLDIQMHQLGFLQPDESLATRTLEVMKTWFKPSLLGDFLGSFVSAAGGIMVTLTAVTFILFFFLKDNHLFMDILHALVPDKMESKVRHAVDESSEVLTRYLGGLLLQTAAFSLSITILLWVMGVPNALLIGVMGGLLNIVPYLGPILGCVLGCVITITSHLDVDFMLWLPLLAKVVGAFMATQFLDNNFVGPMIFSKSVQAHPLEIFIVTLVAAKIGGIGGMVVGIPVYTVLRVVARTFFSEFKLVQRWTDRLEEE